MWRKDQGPQPLSQREEFLSLARKIRSGSYDVGDGNFVAVFYRKDTRFGRMEARAGIFQPQKLDFPTEKRLWREQSVSIVTPLLGVKRPAVFSERYFLVGDNTARLLDARQMEQPSDGKSLTGHFIDELNKIPSGALSKGHPDVNQIRFETYYPLSEFMQRRMDSLVTIATKEDCVKVETPYKDPTSWVSITTAPFSLADDDVDINRHVVVGDQGGIIEYSIQFQLSGQRSPTIYAISNGQLIKRGNGVMGEPTSPTIEEWAKVVETLDALDETHLRQWWDL